MATSRFQESYDYGGIKLVASGYRDEGECVIERITAADSQIDIFDLFSSRAVVLMAESIDARLSREADEENQQACIDRHIWNRDFVVGVAA